MLQRAIQAAHSDPSPRCWGGAGKAARAEAAAVKANQPLRRTHRTGPRSRRSRERAALPGAPGKRLELPGEPALRRGRERTPLRPQSNWPPRGEAPARGASRGRCPASTCCRPPGPQPRPCPAARRAFPPTAPVPLPQGEGKAAQAVPTPRAGPAHHHGSRSSARPRRRGARRSPTSPRARRKRCANGRP